MILGWLTRADHRHHRFIPQMEMTECGAACLAMVLDAHGCGITLAEARVACDVNRNGSRAFTMVQAAESYGFIAEGKSVAVGGLGDLPLPAILHWGFNHFVVLDAVKKDGILVTDPDIGRRRVPMSEVRNLFTGVVLLVSPGPNAVRQSAGTPGLRSWLAGFSSCRRAIIHALAGSVALQVLAIAFPMANQLVVDRVMSTGDKTWLPAIAGALGVAILAERVISFARAWILSEVQSTMDTLMMGRFVDHLMSLPYVFFAQRRPGDLVQRVSLNELAREALADRIIPAILDVGMLLACLTLLLAYSLKLGLVAVGLGLARVGIAMAMRTRVTEAIASELTAGGQEAAVLTDAIAGIETIKSGRMEGPTLERWHTRFAERMGIALKRDALEGNAAATSSVVQALAMTLVFWLGGLEVIAGRMTPGSLAAFLALQSIYLVPLESLVAAYWGLRTFRGTLDRLDDVFGSSPDPDGTVHPGRLSGAVTLQGVSFAYAKSLPDAVSGVSLQIAPGERIALVGKSGSGKSTLASLLIGELRPTAGRILLDDNDLKDLAKGPMRRFFGVVQQGGTIFNDSVLANITMGSGKVDMADVQRALAIACLEEEVAALPDGVMTILGEGGERLSGGQKQRILVARAVASNPSLLLMDEATSALDLETERRLHKNLASLGCTRIVIAHRPMTTLDADRVIVLEDGKIVQDGTPAALLAMPGHLADMIQRLGGDA